MALPLAGTRVLLVEDEALVAMLLEDVLEELGCKVVGPVSRIDAAKIAIEDETFDCALLDINLRGQPVYPLVKLLDERAVPFGFVTGYGTNGVEKQFNQRPILEKPFTARELETVLTTMTRNRGGPGRPGRIKSKKQ
jgi:DNA-binding response OmpR family regulator